MSVSVVPRVGSGAMNGDDSALAEDGNTAAGMKAGVMVAGRKVSGASGVGII